MVRRVALPVLFAVFAFASAPARANSILNGGFETGDFSNWTQFGDTSFSDVDPCCGSAGTFGAFFGPVVTTGGIVQTIATISGETYEFSFDLLNQGGGSNFFSAEFGSFTVLSFTDGFAQPYTTFTFSIPATSASTDVRFTFFQPPAFMFLDEVSVEQVGAVAEPTSMILLGTGLALAARARRRTKTRA